ncbi:MULTISPECIES: PspC domain-containing protein [unclassified Streptomyces]|uniref:PspC domain-containing protein n=1 Tax=unclassified Streptomyces TaxID=2593676 RepID=UPI002E8232C2|nr:PspC domain-containing protein [Streptomyces sp. NBC_00589]WTI36829.1 PspC domain-containing protein [Streptomyces sp. NBC_00775]WUB29495.1 PspC domain-containing protein [Streptomyces sp. NBC_00589]
MTDQQHAAAEPDPGPGPGAPTPGTGHRDAVPPAPGPAEGAQGEEPRAHENPAEPTAPLQPDVPRKFRRDRRQKILGGVCAGLGRQCDMDPVIFRIVLAVLAATGGIGLIFYGFVWLFVPYDDEEENEVRKLLTGRVDGQALTAVLFALVGCGVFLSMLKNGGVLTFAVVLSLLLAGAGYWSQQRGTPDPDPLAAQAVADAPPEAQAPPVPASYPSWWRDPIVKDGSHVGGTGYLWGPKDARDRDVAAAVNIARGTSRPDIRTTREPKPRGPRWIGGRVFLLALLAGGLGTGLTWNDHALGTSLQTGLACALIVFGLGIAISSFLGRTGAGSIFLAVLTAALLAASAALPKDISTHWIRTEWTPTATADVQKSYDLGTGVGTLDLTHLNLAKGQTVKTNAEVGAGRLKVIIPNDATVKLDIEVGVGDIQLPGDGKKDVDVEPGKHKQVTLPPTTGDKNGGTLELDLQVGVGQAEVTRATS